MMVIGIYPKQYSRIPRHDVDIHIFTSLHFVSFVLRRSIKNLFSNRTLAPLCDLSYLFLRLEAN